MVPREPSKQNYGLVIGYMNHSENLSILLKELMKSQIFTNMKLNYLIIHFLFITCLFMTACINDDGPKDVAKEIRMEVSSETGITYSLFDDKREHPIECMLVKTKSSLGEWEPLALGAIGGFTYERGHEYYLRVKKTTLANPPADASDCTYSLIEILMDKLMVEPEIPVDKEITSESDIEYQELCPFGKYAIGSLFFVDSDGGIYNSDGSRKPSYGRARIYLEDVLPKDDPNWIKFNHVPYMAIYSFVISPLSDKIRLVRNESSGPMFKDIVPENEYKYVVESMRIDEELRYTLILANVEKLGLQKLSFTIRKQ